MIFDNLYGTCDETMMRLESRVGGPPEWDVVAAELRQRGWGGNNPSDVSGSESAISDYMLDSSRARWTFAGLSLPTGLSYAALGAICAMLAAAFIAPLLQISDYRQHGTVARDIAPPWFFLSTAKGPVRVVLEMTILALSAVFVLAPVALAGLALRHHGYWLVPYEEWIARASFAAAAMAAVLHWWAMREASFIRRVLRIHAE